MFYQRNQRHITTSIKCNKCPDEAAKYYPTCRETEATHLVDLPEVNPDVPNERLKKKGRDEDH